jgi:hypothetical protein
MTWAECALCCQMLDATSSNSNRSTSSLYGITEPSMQAPEYRQLRSGHRAEITPFWEVHRSGRVVQRGMGAAPWNPDVRLTTTFPKYARASSR